MIFKMWKRRKLKKKISELEISIARVTAMILSNKRLLSSTYGEFNISRLALENESLEREKITLESELTNLRQKLSKL